MRLEAEIAERKRAEARLGRSEARFRTLVAMSSDWYWEQDEHFRFTEANEPAEKDASIMPPDFLGKTRWELLSRGVSAESWAEHRELLGQHRPFRNFEFERLNARGEWIWVSVNGDPLFDGEGTFCGYRGTGRDVSHRKRHEERIELIMREVAHREKNMLSLVMAVARQTADPASEKFATRFSDRLKAIAVNLDHLVNNQWQGSEIGALLRSQLAHFDTLLDKRIRIRGPAVRLTAGATQIIGMAVHELATNAGKYGALANDTGEIEITWRLIDNGAEPCFALSWLERGGPPVRRPARDGFGSKVIGQMARAGLGAEIFLEFPSTSLRWSLRCNASSALEAEKIQHH